MITSHALILATFMITLLAVENTEATFEQLNNHLEKVVDSDEIAANMEAASTWLVEGKHATYYSKTEFPLDDLVQFISLKQVIEDNKCDRTANGIMRDIEEATGLHKLLSAGGVKRRVDRVILEIFKNHAKKCKEIYKLTYQTKKRQLDEKVNKLVENLTNVIVTEDKRRTEEQSLESLFDSNNLLDRYIKSYPAIRDFARENSLFNALQANAERDLDFKRFARVVPDEQTGEAIVNADKIRELIKNYLIRPCQQYVAEFEADLFGPVRFELPIFTTADDHDDDFYRGWAISMICQALIGRERLVIHHVIEYIIKTPIV